jgi:SAM-dependent methyltransferase
MYEQSFAAVYDAVYRSRKDYAADARLLAELIRSHVPDASSLLDVACGTGEHLSYLRTEFAEVTGVDASAAMLAVAAQKLPGVPLSVADMREFDLGRQFDAVCCLFSSIGYMRDVDELRAAARCLLAHVRPGGVAVVEPWLTPEVWRAGTIGHDVVEEPGRTIIRMSHSQLAGRTSLSTMHYLVGTADGVESYVDRHELTLFTWDEYRDAFAAAGGTVTIREDGGPTGRGLVVAKVGVAKVGVAEVVVAEVV